MSFITMPLNFTGNQRRNKGPFEKHKFPSTRMGLAAQLRQAFLDPDSRIRLANDPLPEDHVEFVAMTWEGGFLSGSGIHFNENLNVLIGGRGTGKSTVIESLRCVLQLQPATEDASRNHVSYLL